MLLSVGFFAKRQPPEEELRLLENKQTKKKQGGTKFWHAHKNGGVGRNHLGGRG